jgi:hypothetical protein
MSLLFWASLIVLLVTSIGGITLTVVRAIELVRAFRAFSRVAGAGAERILNATATMEQRLQETASADRLARSTAELQRSLVPARVLLRELRRLRTTAGGMRALVPRK